MKKYRYWCDDCKSFVDKNHRCQQWQTVSMMPEEAFKKIKMTEKEKAIAIIKNIIDYNSVQGWGRALRYAVKELEEKLTSPNSIMPEKVFEKLEFQNQEMRDVLEQITGTTDGGDCQEIARDVLKEIEDE